MNRMVRSLLCALAFLTASASAVFAQSASPTANAFQGWTSVIIAADWTDSRGMPIEAFDNARRDLAAAFESAGFDRSLMVDYTLNPFRPDSVTPQAALQGAEDMAASGTAGCFLYFTSHGAPSANGRPGYIVFGPNGRIEHQGMASILDRMCGDRPTVVVISACFSGGFIPAVTGPNRLVITAARRDRSSFGCAAGVTYPYFDGCMIESLPGAADFLDLVARARSCVSRREVAEGLSPPSEPQTSIGARMQLLAPTLRFHTPVS